MSGNDALAITNLMAAYCAAADRMTDAAQDMQADLLAVLHPDVQGDYGAGPLSGAKPVAAFLQGSIAGNSAWMVHMLHSPQIEIAGARASGRWTVMVHAKRRDSGEIDQIIGRYEADFVHMPAGWRIAAIRFTQIK
jgi:hypothetical protein